MSGAYLVGVDGCPFFDEDRAVAEMLLDNLLLVSDEDGEAVLVINCNDLWVPGADDEPLCYDDIEALYQASCDPAPGAVRRWLCEQYGREPWCGAL